MDIGKLCFVNMQYVYAVNPNVLIQKKKKISYTLYMKLILKSILLQPITMHKPRAKKNYTL